MATHGLLSADAPRLIEESAIDEVRTSKLVILVMSILSRVEAMLISNIYVCLNSPLLYQ